MNHQELMREVWRRLDEVIHPRMRGRENLFTWLNIFLIFLLLGIPLAAATPFLSDWSGCQVASLIKSVIGRDRAMQVCDWSAIFFQVAIFAAIGGIAFTQKLATDLERTVTRLRDDLIASQHQHDEEDARLRQGEMLHLLEVLQSPGNYGAKVKEVARLMRAALGDANFISYRYMWFAAKGVAFNFPGGLYGLLGFFFLSGQIYALSAKVLLDHLPEACQWL